MRSWSRKGEFPRTDLPFQAEWTGNGLAGAPQASEKLDFEVDSAYFLSKIERFEAYNAKISPPAAAILKTLKYWENLLKR